ncbi:MAG: hypothetical protein V3U02_08445 [Calditrichia bacterium]
MIQIKPNIQHKSNCPHCGTQLVSEKVLWQGIHVCVVSNCPGCSAEIIEDLKIGHAIFYPYQVDLENNKLFGTESARAWFGVSLLNSLKYPKNEPDIEFKVEKFFNSKNVVILNCIDFLYGHSLLKLLNADSYLKGNPEFDLVVIVPKFLRWMVPQGVAEIWTVNIPISKERNYYPEIDRQIKRECERFDTIYVSLAHSHPKYFNITRFTGIERHDFSRKDFRVTFIWREDRLWWRYDFLFQIARKLKFLSPLLIWQNLKVRRLFSLLRRDFPQAVFTVAGLGRSTRFPKWIDDHRVERFTDELERKACKIYSESRLVIGIHGSNMLLPSGHAGLTMDLMPDERWGNYAQDVLYQEDDNRLSSFKYRYLPLSIMTSLLYKILSFQLKGYTDSLTGAGFSSKMNPSAHTEKDGLSDTEFKGQTRV